MVKIIDKIKALDEEQTFFSYEYFPPKTDAGVLNLFDRIDRMARTEPLFCDCTWGAGGSTSDLTLEICTTVQKFFGLDIMMHLTCTNITRDSLFEARISNGDQNTTVISKGETFQCMKTP